MSEYDLVSVIIPAWNAERHISQTLQSVLGQTYQNLEVLVVDDGSVDRTPDIVAEHARRDSRLTLLRQPNRGVAAARNLAIDNSHGRFIAPIDADDLWHPSKLQRQLDVLHRSSTKVGLVYTWSQRIDEAGGVVGKCSGTSIEGSVYLPLLMGNFIGNSSAPLFRRRCLESMQGYDERFREFDAQGCEDWEFYLRIAERFEFVAIPDCLVQYRRTAGGMSTDAVRMARSYRLLLAAVRERHPAISEFVYRWSTSAYYLYVANTCLRNSEHRKTFVWLLESLRHDPAAVLNGQFLRVFLRCLARSIGLPIGEPGSAGGPGTALFPAQESPGAPPTWWARLKDRRYSRLLALQRSLNLGPDESAPPAHDCAFADRRLLP